MTNYTKGKWEAVEFNHTSAVEIQVKGDVNQRFKLVAACFNRERDENRPTYIESVSNAERICHCVNTYDELKAQRDELLEACEGLMAAFVHVEGDVKGNKARTDIFKHGQGKGGMAEAANKARVAIAKARCE